MANVAFAITSVCTLKCRHCVEYSPYANPPEHFSLEASRQCIQILFQMVSHLNRFTITGGEPLLHPQLSQIIDIVGEYKNQFDRFEIITNGSVDFSDRVLDAIIHMGEKADLLIDDYGPHLSTKVQKIIKKLEHHNIKYRVRCYHGDQAHCGGWVDFGNLVTEKYHTIESQKQNLKTCIQYSKLHFSFPILDGIIYPCSPSRKAVELSTIPFDSRYCINLLDDTLTIEQQREKLYNLMHTDYLPACAYCNGMHDDSPRFTPAQQLTREELDCVKQGARTYHEISQQLKLRNS